MTKTISLGSDSRVGRLQITSTGKSLSIYGNEDGLVLKIGCDETLMTDPTMIRQLAANLLIAASRIEDYS
jgi:hypothetical protein